MSLFAVPITLKEANAFVLSHHRHNKPVVGCRFCIGASCGESILGVAIVGRPIARTLDDGLTAEVLRVCTPENAQKNVCSFLYGRCWRIWQAMGGQRMITYTMKSESGSSLKACGWKVMGETKPTNKGQGWQSRDGRAWQDIYNEPKFRWEA